MRLFCAVICIALVAGCGGEKKSLPSVDSVGVVVEDTAGAFLSDTISFVPPGQAKKEGP